MPCPPRPAPKTPRRQAQSGVATLLVVMALFFLVSMVAAYASRNLVFEQRISANQYRATQAFELAEGGVDWALALLNGSRVDGSCAASVDVASDRFRTRYLRIDGASGVIDPVRWNSPTGSATLTPSCLRHAEGWTCSCPANAAPVLADPGGPGVKPVFRVQFEATTTPGILRISSTGCTANDDSCLRLARGEGAEAAARLNVTVALVPALAQAPVAAITTRGQLAINGIFRVVNDDASVNGLTVHAGSGAIPAAVELFTVPGTPAERSTVIDPALAALTPDRMFVSYFGASRQAFQRQPTTLSFTCAGAFGTRLRDFIAQNPGRAIWVTDALDIDSDVAIGSADMPALLVVNGPVDMSAAGASITGVVYSQAAAWPSKGRGSIVGALVAEGDVIGPSAPDVRYDAAVISRIRLMQGPMVRVPGGWRDF
jgi:Tfp pilus assembly protein PilX